MATRLHVYVSDSQPMTRFDIGGVIGDKPRFIRRNKRHQSVCHQCGAKRYAKNLRVQVYYDKIHVFCAGGCKKAERGRRATERKGRG